MKCLLQKFIIKSLKYNSLGIGTRIAHHIKINHDLEKNWIEFQQKDGKPISTDDFFNHGLYIDWYYIK